jgi:predicted transcriptional regulator
MRQKLFLSQEAFAREIAVSVSTVNRWKIGKSVPNLSTVKRIKDFCDRHNVYYVPIEESWLAAR